MRDGEPYKRPDRPGWWIRWRERGPDGKVRRRKQYAGKDLAEARRLLRARQGDEERRRLGIARAVSLATFVADELYPLVGARLAPKSFEAFAGRVERAATHFGDRALGTITRADAAAFLAGLGRAPMTVRNYRSALSTTWRLAIERKAAHENPWRDLELPRVHERAVPFLSESDLERVYAALPEHLAPLARFLGETGTRLGEALSLRWDAVSTDDRVFTVRKSKTGRSRDVPLSAAARAAMGRRGAAEERVFAAFGGAMPRAWRNHWKEAVKSVGHPTLRLHDLRHAAASLLVRGGVPVTSVARWLGHTTPALVLTRYGHHAPANELDDALRRREEARRGTRRAPRGRSGRRTGPARRRGPRPR